MKGLVIANNPLNFILARLQLMKSIEERLTSSRPSIVLIDHALFKLEMATVENIKIIADQPF